MLDAIGIVCEDIQKSISFYNQLGLEFKKFGDDHFEATMESGIRLMLDSEKLIKEINPKWEKGKNTSVVLAFKFSKVNNVDELFEKLISCGATEVKVPWDAFWGQRYASLLDLDGNQIDLFAALES